MNTAWSSAWGGTALKVLALALLWAVISGGSPASWLIGVPAIALASYLGRSQGPSRGWRWRALPGFVLFMLREMSWGGLQAARLALGPRRLLRPGFVRLPLRLRGERARVLMIDCTSLIPGTLSADLEGEELVVHVLDRRQPVIEDCRRLEGRIAALFPEEDML